MSEIDLGSLGTGLAFTLVGAAFVLEAAGAWTFSLVDLRILGPLALILIGVAVLSTGRRRSDRPG
jgi:hypothetical protein